MIFDYMMIIIMVMALLVLLVMMTTTTTVIIDPCESHVLPHAPRPWAAEDKGIASPNYKPICGFLRTAS